jgi:hypothetical protein
MTMARNGTFDTQRTEARKLYDQHLSCRAIADRLHVSPSTISRWAKQECLKFDRSKVEAAVKAHTIDLAAERLLLANEMMEAARVGLRELKGTFLVYSFGGKDNTYEEHELAKAPPSVRREMMSSAGIAFDKATKVVEKSTNGVEGAHSLLDALLGRFEAETPADGE